MAAIVIPPGFAHLTLFLVSTENPHTCAITDGFEVLAPPFTQANTDALFTDLANALHPLYDGAWTLGPLQLLVGNDGPLIRLEHTGTSGGTRSTQVEPPPQVTYLIKKQTGFSGRQFRGRSYWPFGGNQTALSQSGVLTSAENTLLATAAAAWHTALNKTADNTASQVLLHSTTTAPTPVTAFTPERIVATQRRRLERVGA